MTADEVKQAIVNYVNAQSNGAHALDSQNVSDDLDLLTSGLIDSLGVFGLIEDLQSRYGEDIDFEELDPDDMTIVGPLSRFVAERATA